MPIHRSIVLAFAGVLVSAGALAHDPGPLGSAAIGRALYTGAIPFEKGGAPCGACHAVGGQGAALNASFGPDLSKSPAALDGDILDGVLEDQPYKSMKPIYAGKKITPAERAHLTSFLQEAAGKVTARGGAGFAGQAALIAIALGALLAWGRRRTVPAREQLQRKARRIQGETR